METIEYDLGKFEKYKDKPVEFIDEHIFAPRGWKINSYQENLIRKLKNCSYGYEHICSARRMGRTTVLQAYALYRNMICKQHVIYMVDRADYARNVFRDTFHMFETCNQELFDNIILTRTFFPNNFFWLNNNEISVRSKANAWIGIGIFDAFYIADIVNYDRNSQELKYRMNNGGIISANYYEK